MVGGAVRREGGVRAKADVFDEVHAGVEANAVMRDDQVEPLHVPVAAVAGAVA